MFSDQNAGSSINLLNVFTRRFVASIRRFASLNELCNLTPRRPSKSTVLFDVNARSFIIQTKFSKCCKRTITDNNSSVSSTLRIKRKVYYRIFVINKPCMNNKNTC